jgi:hypothetical protein
MDQPRARILAKNLQLLNSSATRTLYFHGKSMLPFLQEGDGLVVQPVNWKDIRIGDIITYRFADKFPTRRVVRKLDETLVLWCENWPMRRFRAPRQDVLGRVAARERNGSWLKPRDAAWRRATRRALVQFYTRVLLNKAARAWSKAGRKSRARRHDSHPAQSSQRSAGRDRGS